MADTINLDIPINKSPVPAALDAYYDFVKDLAKPGPGDRVGLLGTVINYDIHNQARLYNDYVVRAFADRTARTSPIAAQGVGDLAERYSARYSEMLQLLVASLDSELDADAKEQLQRHRTTIRVVSGDRDKWLNTFEDGWSSEMERLGIDLTKIDVDEAVRLRFYERRVVYMKHRKFADMLKGFNDDIEQEELAIESLRFNSYPDDEARELILLHKESKKVKTTRPRRPELETKYGWDELTIQNPEYADMPDIFDIGPMIESIVDPRTILNGAGTRGFEVKTDDSVTNNHDNDWSGSGGGSYMSFIKGSFSSSGDSHFRSTITNTRKVSVNFEHLGMLDISRGGWFASKVFEFERVKKYLKRNPILKQKLNFLTTGLLIGRGLTLTLHFNDKSDVHEWGKTRRSGGGGINVFGYKLGGGGGGSSTWESKVVNEVDKTVTFKDDPTVCRLLAIKVTPMIEGVTVEEVAFGARPLREIPLLRDAAAGILSSGQSVDSVKLFKSANIVT